METRGSSISNLPIAIMDTGTLSEISTGNRRYLARKQDAERNGMRLTRLIDPLTLLEPLMTPGQCTLIIPRFVAQEIFTLPAKPNDAGGEYYEYGPTQNAGNNKNHAADIGIESVELFRKYPGLCHLLENTPEETQQDIPRVRYYSTPQAFLQSGEVTSRRGGIAIIDDGALLNDTGIYLSRRSTRMERGDDQIRHILQTFREADIANARFPIISSDYKFLSSAVNRECDKQLCVCKPFPMNLRALISSYQEVGLLDIDSKRAEALYRITNREREKFKTPESAGWFRDNSIGLAVPWLQALHGAQQSAGTVISKAQSPNRVCPISTKAQG